MRVFSSTKDCRKTYITTTYTPHNWVIQKNHQSKHGNGWVDVLYINHSDKTPLSPQRQGFWSTHSDCSWEYKRHASSTIYWSSEWKSTLTISLKWRSNACLWSDSFIGTQVRVACRFLGVASFQLPSYSRFKLSRMITRKFPKRCSV